MVGVGVGECVRGDRAPGDLAHDPLLGLPRAESISTSPITYTLIALRGQPFSW